MTRLGARDDLKAFNDAVVLGGDVTLDVLAKKVDAHVAFSGSGAGASTTGVHGGLPRASVRTYEPQRR